MRLDFSPVKNPGNRYRIHDLIIMGFNELFSSGIFAENNFLTVLVLVIGFLFSEYEYEYENRPARAGLSTIL